MLTSGVVSFPIFGLTLESLLGISCFSSKPRSRRAGTTRPVNEPGLEPSGGGWGPFRPAALRRRLLLRGSFGKVDGSKEE